MSATEVLQVAKAEELWSRSRIPEMNVVVDGLVFLRRRPLLFYTYSPSTMPGFSAIIWNGGIAGLQRDARSAGSQLQWRLGGLHLRSVVASPSQTGSDDLAWERCLSS